MSVAVQLPAMGASDTTVSDAERASSGLVGTLSRYANNESVAVRFATVWAVCVLVFTVAWTVGYYALPEGLLRGSLGAEAPVVAGTVWGTVARLFAWNLVLGLGPVVAFNTLRSVNTPASYVLLVAVWLQGGLVYGTNSLGIEAGRLAPSLSTALGRSGVYELTAYVLVGVATRSLLVWHQRSGSRWREEFERVRSPREWSLTRREWVLVLAGIVLLALANYREAVMIHRALG